jgi:methyl coenzyme M reductase beta subunit
MIVATVVVANNTPMMDSTSVRRWGKDLYPNTMAVYLPSMMAVVVADLVIGRCAQQVTNVATVVAQNNIHMMDSTNALLLEMGSYPNTMGASSQTNQDRRLQ